MKLSDLLDESVINLGLVSKGQSIVVQIGRTSVRHRDIRRRGIRQIGACIRRADGRATRSRRTSRLLA